MLKGCVIYFYGLENHYLQKQIRWHWSSVLVRTQLDFSNMFNHHLCSACSRSLCRGTSGAQTRQQKEVLRRTVKEGPEGGSVLPRKDHSMPHAFWWMCHKSHYDHWWPCEMVLRIAC